MSNGERVGMIIVLLSIIGGFSALFTYFYLEDRSWNKNRRLLKKGKLSVHTLIMKMLFERGCIATPNDLAPSGPPYRVDDTFTPLSHTDLTAEKILAVMLSEPGYYTPDLSKPKRHPSVDWEPGKATIYTPFELNPSYRNIFAENLYGDDFELQEKIRDRKLSLLLENPDLG